MNKENVSFWPFLWRITAVHTVTYFIAGLLAAYLFHYKESFETGDLSGLMKPFDSPMVMIGPMLQPLRGVLFSLVLWPFRSVFLERERGWFYLWILFLGLAILGTCGPAPGSFEGMIYTKLPVIDQIVGLRETVFQTLLFSLLVYYWWKFPRKIWNILAVILLVLILLMMLAGLLASGI